LYQKDFRMNPSQRFHSKMEMESLKLKWSNHSPNFISVFSQLLNSESLVDVTLAADGKTIQGTFLIIHFTLHQFSYEKKLYFHYFPAHRVVLSACSTYFQVYFTLLIEG
jgi:hypothetical protein